MNTSTTAATPTVVKIKKELPSDEIKEFAESTMNELLGWYGFDSVDRLDLSAKTSKLLQTAGIISAQQQQQQQHHSQSHQMEKRRSRSSRAASLLHMQHQQQQQQQHQNEHLHTLNSSNNNHNNSISNNNNKNISSSNNNNNNNSSSSSSNNRKTTLNCNNSNNSHNYRGNGSTTSDHDTRSSRDDDSKSPNSAGKTLSTTTNIIDDKIVDYQNCCWCRRPVPENAPEFLTTSDGPRYCSESCFTQSRRASFKKAKTCDWCKHVRHAVSYVDFQDGASQLQFCSDKCLNQYKMQIFCKETQAHLDMNPHLKEQGLEAASNGANLITPDLWLRNCRSRSASPASTVSISPGPSSHQANLTAGTLSPLPRITAMNNTLTHNSNTCHKPLISVAPVSKLMSKSPSILQSRQSPKHNRKKRPVRACVSGEMAGVRGTEMKTNCTASSIKPKPLMSALGDNGRSSLNQNNCQTLTQFAASCVQDLHMNVPPLSPALETQTSQPTTPHSLPPTPNRSNNTSTTIPPAFFATPPNNQTNQPIQPGAMTAPGFPPRPGFLHNPNGGFLPRFMGNFSGLPPPLPHTLAGLMPPDIGALNTLIGTPPPVTVMVPYPIIIPLPIPIPVPLPVVDFYKAHLTPDERKKYDDEQKLKKEGGAASEIVQTPIEITEEQPLDFTKTKEMETEDMTKTRTRTSQQQLEATSEKEDVVTTKEEEAEELTNLDSTPPEVIESSTKTLHCIVANEDTADNTSNNSPKLKSDFVANTQEINEDSSDLQSSSTGAGGETNQKLPKLKITRLQTKRTLIQTKESECSRPLRKRKRIIDCDFQKLNTSSNNNKEANDIDDDVNTTTTEKNKCNKGQTNSNNNKK